jgi:hypothetical protein
LNSTLNAGDVVTATVTMSEAVVVSGAPQLALNIGGTTVQGTYDSVNSSTTALKFNYTILASQTDANGISIAANSLGLNSGTIIDSAGNAATITHSLVADNSSYKVDTTVPSLTVNTATSDDVINSAERTAGVTMTGTVEAGASVTVNGNAATVTGTAWSYTFSAAAINAFAILDSLGSTELSVVATDSAGNATTTKVWPKIDTTAPSLTVNKATTDDVINSAERTAGVTMTGTVEAGASVTVNGIAATVSGTTWSYTFNASAIDAFGQGTEELTVIATDAAGNTSTTKAWPKVDTIAPSAPTITSVTDDVSPVTGNLTSGDSTNDARPTVRVSLTGTTALAGDAVQLYNSTTVLGSATTLTSSHIEAGYVDITTSALSRGSYALNAKVIDAAGNASSGSASFALSVDLTTTSSTSLSGLVYQWKTHALLSNVMVDLVSPGVDAPSTSSHLYELRNVQTVSDRLVVDLWVNLTQGVGNLDIAINVSGNLTPAFTASSNLPTGWTALSSNSAGKFTMAAYGLSNATGSILLGQLDLGLVGSSPTQMDISGVAGELTTRQAQNVYSVQIDKTESSGLYDFTNLSAGTYDLIASKSLTSSETGTVISSADALATLKIAVGMNPNSDPDGTGPLTAPSLSPYQLIAADVNSDGKVTSADALGVLKMAVNYTGAASREWLFVPETQDFWNETTQTMTISRSSVVWDSGGKEVVVGSGASMNLVGVLKGDVNGSWTAPTNSEIVATSHFTDLITQGLGTTSQWVL